MHKHRQAGHITGQEKVPMNQRAGPHASRTAFKEKIRARVLSRHTSTILALWRSARHTGYDHVQEPHKLGKAGLATAVGVVVALRETGGKHTWRRKGIWSPTAILHDFRLRKNPIKLWRLSSNHD
jgi:hypothetical protein